MSPTEQRLAELPDSVGVRQLARALRVTEQTVRRWGNDGTLPRPIRLGPRKTYFARDEVLARIRQAAEQVA
jgi:predicted DNA-binding transcriptional regulator AlpA